MSLIAHWAMPSPNINNRTKIGRKPILNQEYCIVSADHYHQQPCPVNCCQSFWAKPKHERSESLAFLKALNIRSLFPQQKIIFDVNDNPRAEGWSIHLWQMHWVWKSASSEKIAQPRTSLRSATSATERPSSYGVPPNRGACHVGRTSPPSHIIQQQLSLKCICLSCGFHSSSPCFQHNARISNHCSWM